MIKSLTSGREFIFPEQFSVDKSTALCFTGHREKNIPPYNELYKYKNLLNNMRRYIVFRIERKKEWRLVGKLQKCCTFTAEK